MMSGDSIRVEFFEWPIAIQSLTVVRNAVGNGGEGVGRRLGMEIREGRGGRGVWNSIGRSRIRFAFFHNNNASKAQAFPIAEKTIASCNS